MLNLLKRAANTVPNPDANHVSVFIDAAGAPSTKDSAGVVAVLRGADPAITMGVVVHGAEAGTGRAAGYAAVTWVGEVEPTDAFDHDIWEDTSVSTLKIKISGSFVAIGLAASGTTGGDANSFFAAHGWGTPTFDASNLTASTAYNPVALSGGGVVPVFGNGTQFFDIYGNANSANYANQAPYGTTFDIFFQGNPGTPTFDAQNLYGTASYLNIGGTAYYAQYAQYANSQADAFFSVVGWGYPAFDARNLYGQGIFPFPTGGYSDRTTDVAIGQSSLSSYGGVSIGVGSTANYGGVAIGQNANGIGGVAVGVGANGASGTAIGQNAYGPGLGNFAAGGDYTGTLPAVVPNGFTNTIELGRGAATLNGGLNFRGIGIVDYNGGNPRHLGLGAVIAGTATATGTSTTTVTVTIGRTMANTTYKANAEGTNALSAAMHYIANKTTTTFDVVYLTGLTGAIAFDWIITQ